MHSSAAAVHQHSSPEAKISLFRSLFCGRDDVYARRFENRRTGAAGYQPACANAWVPGVCRRPAVKCAACPQRRLLPVTDEVIRWHLTGRDADGKDFVLALYPMLRDETCCLLAVDLEKPGWRVDAAAILAACDRMRVPAVLERSCSGRSGHIWLFFTEPIPAAIARRLGAHVLTEAMDDRPEIGLDAYDHFFPDQDTLPQRGFGTLIALPLQKQPRERGDSLFLDPQGMPHVDQWAMLSSLARMDRLAVEELVRKAEHRQRVFDVRMPAREDGSRDPWASAPRRCPSGAAIAGPLPRTVTLMLTEQISVDRRGLTPALVNRLMRRAAFQNPEFLMAEAMRLPVYGKPRILGCADVDPHCIRLPRGCLEDVLAFLRGMGIEATVRDERCAGTPLGVRFRGQLRPDQEAAARQLLGHETGVLSAPTAFGKTAIACWLIAARGVSTLVLVHRRQLMEQWLDRLSAFLDLPSPAIGRSGGGTVRRTGVLDVALIQSLARKEHLAALVSGYGHLVVDECHHLSAPSFARVAGCANARFVTGLSATLLRKDGHQPIVFMQCGPVRCHVDAKAQSAARPFRHTVFVCPTSFRPRRAADPDARIQYQELLDELVKDDARNQLICQEVVEAVREGRSPLLITERIGHLDRLAGMLSQRIQHVVALRGRVAAAEFRAVLARLAAIREAEDRVLLASGQYIGEGFDDARLDTLFLALPVSWRGTVAQYLGRLHRLHARKREVRVVDFADLNVGMLARMFARRCRAYEAEGYAVQLPGSAIPGWPAEVVLPIDPAWKESYGPSVLRLASDGVDPSLAKLFALATQARLFAEGGSGEPRSAVEAFLYQRLESLPETTGRFSLNRDLPIPFDGVGRMEVDLLCPEARLAVELDGPQHLESPEAYRRDRRKDALLQENGYYILRFLAEDVVTHLDAVLDTILRALAHRRAC